MNRIFPLKALSGDTYPIPFSEHHWEYRWIALTHYAKPIIKIYNGRKHRLHFSNQGSTLTWEAFPFSCSQVWCNHRMCQKFSTSWCEMMNDVIYRRLQDFFNCCDRDTRLWSRQNAILKLEFQLILRQQVGRDYFGMKRWRNIGLPCQKMSITVYEGWFVGLHGRVNGSMPLAEPIGLLACCRYGWKAFSIPFGQNRLKGPISDHESSQKYIFPPEPILHDMRGLAISLSFRSFLQVHLQGASVSQRPFWLD